MDSPYYFLKDLTPDDYDDFRRFVAYGGIDNPSWYDQGKTPDEATAEYMGYVRAVRVGLLEKDLVKSVCVQATGEMIGLVTLSAFEENGSADLSYYVAAPYQGQGIATWAAFTLVGKAVAQHGLNAIETTVRPDNGSSLGILRKLGARQIGFVEATPYNDRNGSPIPALVVRAEKPGILRGLEAYARSGKRPGLPSPLPKLGP